jgi:Bacteriophage baseplate protein W
MNGTSALDGKQLSGIDHLRQSIRDILSTPLGSRVGRRWYGSELFNLVDAPINRQTLADIYRATAVALSMKNPLTGQPVEPRFVLQKVVVSSTTDGSLELDLTGDYLPEGQTITLDGINVT